MQNYLDLLDDILTNGENKENRTGIGTRMVFGRMLRFNLSDGFPLVTTRKIPFRLVFEETMFFLRGETDTKILEEKNVNIWKGNTTREFLDSRNLDYLPEGDMGKGYGAQWRNFGGTNINDVSFGNDEYKEIIKDLKFFGGVDQIYNLIEGLKNDPDSRRHIVTAWNPQQLDETALPPCHILQQYQITNGKLNSMFSMRSNDVYLGLPFNIAMYAFLNMAFAHMLGLEPGELVYSGADVHLYQNQLEASKELIKRKPKKPATLKFKKGFNTLDELLLLEYDDIELLYEYDDTKLPEVKMVV